MKLKDYSLAVAALLFFINGACFAQSDLAQSPQSPDTPAANQAKGWLEVFNAGNLEKRREFLQKNYPSRLERFDRETEMRRSTGGFDVVKVAESTPTKIVLLIQERLGDQLAQFTVEVEPAPPHAVKQFQFQVLPRAGEFAIPHLSDRSGHTNSALLRSEQDTNSCWHRPRFEPKQMEAIDPKTGVGANRIPCLLLIVSGLSGGFQPTVLLHRRQFEDSGSRHYLP